MSVAALAPRQPPAPHLAMSASSKRPIMQPRPSSSTLAVQPAPSIRSRPTIPAPPIVHRRSSSSSIATPRTAAAPLPPVGNVAVASGSKDTSSSSGKVFAKPSKEWVLPERAKPGRKVSVEEPDNKRQSQNRLSQRAHRARRTDYIQTLEERLRQYEADEIHSNVRLQEVARALKADNERLKKETVTLRLEISELQAQRNAWDEERASYEELVRRISAELKTLRGGEGLSPHFVTRLHRHDSNHSSPTIMPTLVPDSDRRATMDCPICPDPDPDCPCQQRDNTNLNPLRQTPLAALHLAVKAMAEQIPSDPTPGGTSCGVCQTNDECLCRAIDGVEEEDIKPVIFPTPSPELDFGGPVPDGCGLCTSATFCACKANASVSSHSNSSQSPIMGISTIKTAITTSIYPTPPSSTEAVPLRLGRDRVKAAPIWSLDPIPAPQPKEAECSGDPKNCDACRDDSFGKEFCENLFEKTESVGAPAKPCADCPGDCMSIKSLLCSSDPSKHTQHPSLPEINQPRSEITQLSSRPGIAIDHNGETMTCDQAWKALKAHPNSKFASLSLLADVVSGRTVCTGPKDISSSVPGSPVSLPSPGSIQSLRQDIGVGSPKSVYKPSSLGPAQVGKKRNMAVETSAVRDALRLLDNTPSSLPSSPIAIRDEGPDAKKRKVGL